MVTHLKTKRLSPISMVSPSPSGWRDEAAASSILTELTARLADGRVLLGHLLVPVEANLAARAPPQHGPASGQPQRLATRTRPGGAYQPSDCQRRATLSTKRVLHGQGRSPGPRRCQNWIALAGLAQARSQVVQPEPQEIALLILGHAGRDAQSGLPGWGLGSEDLCQGRGQVIAQP